MKTILIPVLLLFSFFAKAQNNVRAWYADGQVWVVWEFSLPLPETYAVYAKPTAFTNTANATLIGRLFKFEYGPFALKEQVDSSLTYRIPDGQGGTYQLAPNEALFVATPHQAGSLWIAVVPWGQTAVTAGVNITQNAVPFSYNPANDPVECHLQAAFPSPFAAGYTCLAFYMWADGRQNYWEGRPDFPIMANAAKNGMPSLFFVSVPLGLDTTGGIPASIWLHGGEGTARQSLAGSRTINNLNPTTGILVAHNDDLVGYRYNAPPNPFTPSWHFGWRKNYDPFNPSNGPVPMDTVINYTERRYIWIDQWLIRTFHVDPTRININGHSMGSAGSTAIAKAYPDHYATATIFNNGFGSPVDSNAFEVFGPSDMNFPTNLKNRAGDVVRMNTVFNITDRNAPERDLPLFRSFHGKNDDNAVMMWDSGVVAQYRAVDSLGWGAQLSWSERAHGVDTGPDYSDHWFDGNLPTQQTEVDDIAYEENHFRSDVSFPGFFNNRLDPTAHDPGDGTRGIGPNGVGDDWGTWGGYHRWDWDNITDQTAGWSVVAWLESSAVFVNDNCPNNQLVADLAIRKPRHFKPATGNPLHWNVKDVATGAVLQSGNILVRADSLVVIPQVTVFKENIRKVRISVVDPSVSTKEPNGIDNITVFPNPATDRLFLNGEISVVKILNQNGRIVLDKQTGNEHELDISQLPAGMYFLEILTTAGFRQSGRFVKI